MSLLHRRPSLRWIAPLFTLGLVVSVPGVAQRVASADPGLEPRTAEQLLADLAGARPQPLSGTLTQTMELGLPSLPNLGQPSSGNPLSMLSGTHTWRIWTDAKQSFRVAQVEGQRETTLVHNPTDTWLWEGSKGEAVHVKHSAQKNPAAHPDKPATAPTPDVVARRVLTGLDPSTVVTTDSSTTVAGRSAYQLVLTPTSTSTRIGHIRLAIDAQTKLPLRVLVTARGASAPAVNIGWTSLTMGTPDASLFRFTPGKRVPVTEAKKLPVPAASTPAPGSGQHPRPTVVGNGWNSVLVLTTGSPALSADEAAKNLLNQFPVVQGDWGRGRLVSTALVTAVLTDDGRIAVGAVAPDLLYAALR